MRRLTVLLALAFTLALVPAIPARAKKPLVGTMDLEFNLDWLGLGPQPYIPDWAGNITINEEEYRMLFFALDSGKPFEVDPEHSQVHFYGEIWAIYNTTIGNPADLIPSDDPDDWAGWLPSNSPDDLVLWGYDAGVVAWPNNEYRMNGNVEEAFGAFDVWEGRNVHMSGEIVFYESGAPHYAPGTFRIN